jgi:hypothetical protein
VSDPEAHHSRNAAAGHAHPFYTRGAKPAPRGTGTHRAGGRATGRKLGVPHSPQGSAQDDSGAQGPEASIHAGGAAGQPANQGRTPARERILDTCGQAQDGDARNVINARRTGNTVTRAVVSYYPRRGRRYPCVWLESRGSGAERLRSRDRLDGERRERSGS